MQFPGLISNTEIYETIIFQTEIIRQMLTIKQILEIHYQKLKMLSADTSLYQF